MGYHRDSYSIHDSILLAISLEFGPCTSTTKAVKWLLSLLTVHTLSMGSSLAGLAMTGYAVAESITNARLTVVFT